MSEAMGAMNNKYLEGMSWGVLGFLSLLLGFSACSEPTRWSTPVKVVVLDDDLTLSDLLPDDLWTDENGLAVIRIDQTVAEIELGDQMEFLDTSWTEAFTLPFSGGPIPVPPLSIIWEDADELELSMEGVDLRRIRLKSGAMTVTVSSTIQGPVRLMYTFLGGSFPTLPDNRIQMDLNENTVSTVVNLAGTHLDLMGGTGQGFDRLRTYYVVKTMENGGEDIPLYGDDVFTVSFSFEDVVPDQVEGDFGQPAFDLTGTVDFPNFSLVENAQVVWEDIECEMSMVNTLGVDLGVTLNAVTRWKAGLSMALENPSMGQSTLLSRAMIGQWSSSDWSSEPTSSWVLDLGGEQSNLELWAGVFPDSIHWDLGVEFNPLGDVTGGYDRVDFEQLPSLNMDLKIPLRIQALELALGDTTETYDVFTTENPGYSPFTGDLVIQFDNEFDIDMALDAMTVPVDDVPLFDAVILIDALEIPRMGEVTVRIPIDAGLWRVLSTGRGIAWKAKFDSGLEEVQVQADDFLSMKGWLDGQFNWEVE